MIRYKLGSGTCLGKVRYRLGTGLALQIYGLLIIGSNHINFTVFGVFFSWNVVENAYLLLFAHTIASFNRSFY